MMPNIEVVKAYFKYCVDGKDVERVSEFFTEDVVIHRPDCPAPLVGLEVFKKGLRENVTDLYDSIVTTFRFNNEGKVVEEIVERNELHMSHQLGLVLSDEQ